MASINYAARQISVKIVYYGPGLSGKTTNLQVIHKKTPQDHKSDMVSLATETDRTLFFDFLPLDLGKIKGFATKFQLYTVPGQVYYNATRKLVLRGVDGVVFVADSGADKIQENLESFQNLEDNLAEYGYQRESIPIIIQYNKRDLPNALPIEELNRHINKYNLPHGEGIAYKGVGVFDTLKQIGKIVIDYLNKKYSRSGPSRGAAPAAPEPQAPQQHFAPPPPPPQYAPGQTAQFAGYQQPAQQYAPPPPPPQSFEPAAPSFEMAPPPPPPQYTPGQTAQFAGYQQPAQQYAPPPPPQSFEPAAPSFEMAPPPPPQSFEPAMPSFEMAPPPPPQAFEPAAPSFEMAPPPPPQTFEPAAPSFEMAPPPQTFEPAAPSFEMAPPQQQHYAAPGQTAQFAGHQQPAQQYAPPPAQAPQAFDPYAQQQPPPQQAFDPFVQQQPPPAPPAAPAFDPYAQQQQASPWAAPPAAPAADPFAISPVAAPPPAFEMAPPPPPPPPAQPVNYDDMFMAPEPPPAQGTPPAGNQGGYGQSPFDFEMASTPPPPSHTNAPQQGTPGGFGAMDFTPQAPAIQSFEQPSDASQQGEGGKSELDIEIEKYQREIEEKQKKMRSGTGAFPAAQVSRPDVHEMQPYAGQADHSNHFKSPVEPDTAAVPAPAPAAPAPQAYAPQTQAAPQQAYTPHQYNPAEQPQPQQQYAPQQYTQQQSLPQHHSSFYEFEAELEGNSGGGQNANHNQNDGDAHELRSNDSAMFFTSVDRNNQKQKKPAKPPINPKLKAQQQQQQPKGFMSNLFKKPGQ